MCVVHARERVHVSEYMCMRMLLTHLLHVIKVTVMAADVIVITPQMVCKSRDWYQNDRL